MYKHFSITLLLIATLLSSSSYALEFGPPIVAHITAAARPMPMLNGQAQAKASVKKIDVVLMNIKLTPQERRQFIQFSPKKAELIRQAQTALPASVNRGMNGVPVLNQGQHGSCVTFAITAAIDAVLGKGDYISQLCHLEVGSYLESRSFYPSGWDGSIGPYVLNQIMEFGIINKENQKVKSCAGLTEYPSNNMNDSGQPMSLEEFKTSAEDISTTISWQALLTPEQRFQNETEFQNNSRKLLLKIKKLLAYPPHGIETRIAFAALLSTNHCDAGACANHHTADDTWALTKAIENDANPVLGGHAMVIMGYDDNAIAVDNQGGTHQGLLLLRNSWSSEAGDHGDYFMTYDYFVHFVLDVQAIQAITDKA
jgi:hypothetical protein